MAHVDNSVENSNTSSDKATSLGKLALKIKVVKSRVESKATPLGLEFLGGTV